tara:strand:+ start:342 stop:1241 length:900 start_codon:yes stop_codon:yes gene_type:complete
MSFENNPIVLVTGANGFTGRFVCLELKKRGIPLIALLRDSNQSEWMDINKIPYRVADINNSSALSLAMSSCSVLLNVASIGFGATPSILRACNKSGIKRVVFVSTTAIFTKLNAKSKAIRVKAEEDIMKSDLDWTILRPTMIFGTPNDRNIIKLIRYLDRMPFIPVFGTGKFLQQPVYVKDVAWSIVQVINNEKTFKNHFNISGSEPIIFNYLIEKVSEGLNLSRKIIHLPLFLVVFIRLLEFFKIKLPINSEQIYRLNENKNFSYLKAKKTFNYKPTKFLEALKSEINLYKVLSSRQY